jgi:hypothetical protein
VARPQNARAAACIVTNTLDSGAQSLRQAILDSNANLCSGAINITATGTVTLATALPVITNGVTISGPGSSLFHVNVNLLPVIGVDINTSMKRDDFRPGSHRSRRGRDQVRPGVWPHPDPI